MKLQLSPEYTLDTEDYAAEGVRINVMGMSGSGKSNTTAIMAEQILDQGGQVIIIEPVSEWHTLKAEYSNIIVIGGPFQDLPLDARFIGDYVETSLLNGISLIVNVSDLETEEEQRSFVSSFLWSLYRREQRHRKPVFLFLEEADIWAPQQYDKSSMQCRNSVRTIAKRGRKVGINMVLISQRPSDIDKTPSSQCPIQVLGKFTAPPDLDPKSGVMFYAKKLGAYIEDRKVSEKDFMQLKVIRGEYAEFFINDVNGFRKVVIPSDMRKTPHGADTPDIEFAPVEISLAPVLEDLKEKLESAIKARDAEDSEIAKLNKQVEKLTGVIDRQEKQLQLAGDLKALLQGNGGTSNADVTAKVLELEAQHEEEIKQLKTTLSSPEEVEALEKRITAAEENVAAAEQKLEEYNLLESAISTIVRRVIPTTPSAVVDPALIERMVKKAINNLPKAQREKVSADSVTGIPYIDIWYRQLKTPQQRKIVQFLAEKAGTGFTLERLAFLLGISVKSGTFNQNMRNLRDRYKLIVQKGDEYFIRMEAP